jgi:hypothetical protein
MTTQLTGFKQDLVGSYIMKDPAAVLTYSVEWSDWLFSGDTLLSTVITVTAIAGDPAGTALRVVSSGVTTSKAFALIDRGTAGEIYTVTVDIITNNGLRDTRRFRIKVEPRFL